MDGLTLKSDNSSCFYTICVKVAQIDGLVKAFRKKFSLLNFVENWRRYRKSKFIGVAKMVSISFSGRTRERAMPEQIRRQQKNGGGAMELMGSNPRSSGEAGPLNFSAPFFGTRHFFFFFLPSKNIILS